jgi:hypothetical protein
MQGTTFTRYANRRYTKEIVGTKKEEVNQSTCDIVRKANDEKS